MKNLIAILILVLFFSCEKEDITAQETKIDFRSGPVGEIGEMHTLPFDSFNEGFVTYSNGRVSVDLDQYEGEEEITHIIIEFIWHAVSWSGDMCSTRQLDAFGNQQAFYTHRQHYLPIESATTDIDIFPIKNKRINAKYYQGPVSATFEEVWAKKKQSSGIDDILFIRYGYKIGYKVRVRVYTDPGIRLLTEWNKPLYEERLNGCSIFSHFRILNYHETLDSKGER